MRHDGRHLVSRVYIDAVHLQCDCDPVRLKLASIGDRQRAYHRTGAESNASVPTQEVSAMLSQSV